ncbi:preprotein translocase subunit SecG [Lysobacter humi (ex Lee et al. 2017)]
MLFLNIIYVLLAIAMIALILMQRGAGAQAGSGFGGGASGTVFGARGSANFLTKATKWLAIAFFGITLLMAWQASKGVRATRTESESLMTEVPAAPATGAVPAPSTVPAAPASSGASVPAAPAASGTSVPVAPAPTGAAVPAAPTAAPSTTQTPSTGG